MQANLSPRTIEPGWAKRWALQTFDLWTRSFGVTAATVIVILATDLFMPHYENVSLFVVVPLSAFVYTVIRSLDQSGGYQTFSYAWALLQSCLRDIWVFTLQIWLWLLAFTAGIAVASLVIYHKKVMDSSHSTFFLLEQGLHAVPYILRKSLKSGIDWYSLLALPMSGPILYLTLSFGNNLSYHLHNAYLAMFLNKIVSLAGLAVAFFSGQVLELGLLWMTHFLSPGATFAVASICIAFLVLTVTTFSYLYSRELFEGISSNQPRKSAATSSGEVLAHG